MIGPDVRRADLGIGVPEPGAAEGVEREIAARTLAVLLAVGAAMGSINLVVELRIEDPLRYATPLMLLFPALVAAWFLELRQLSVHMVVTAAVCLAAL